jgi:UDP-2,4-diacetamido-2,4,6-trideoxy-beta-L-altropyranose hydrolase
VPLRLRTATSQDVRSIFEWRNDPWIVSLSGSQRTVTWDEHSEWFRKVVENRQCLLLVIESEAPEGIGCVRFDLIDEGRARVTIYLLPRFVGQRLGVPALLEGCRRAFARWPTLRAIHASIRSENTRSIKAFSHAGFSQVVSNDMPSNREIEMVLHREGTAHENSDK